jgi:hypothetical protein
MHPLLKIVFGEEKHIDKPLMALGMIIWSWSLWVILTFQYVGLNLLYEKIGTPFNLDLVVTGMTLASYLLIAATMWVGGVPGGEALGEVLLTKKISPKVIGGIALSILTLLPWIIMVI